jgi:hypothetical protein
MEFFDSKQEVIDIRLTQFGKRLLAKGAFKPVFYQFFDDDILYNSEKAGFSEEQNSAEDRILETPRLKTMHVNSGVETSFKQEQKLIESGSLPVYQEIKEDEQPQVAQKLLTYSLEKSEINSQEAPRFQLSLNDSYIYSTSSSLTVDGVTLPIPQLNLTSSYTLIRDTRNAIDEIPQMVVDSENYLELTADEVEFLDKSTITIRRQDLIIDMDEFGVDLGLDNFEIEIFEITEEKKENPNGEIVTKENLRKLSTREEIKKYFDVRTDSMVPGSGARSRDGRRAPRGRSMPVHLRGGK